MDFHLQTIQNLSGSPSFSTVFPESSQVGTLMIRMALLQGKLDPTDDTVEKLMQQFLVNSEMTHGVGSTGCCFIFFDNFNVVWWEVDALGFQMIVRRDFSWYTVYPKKSWIMWGVCDSISTLETGFAWGCGSERSQWRLWGQKCHCDLVVSRCVSVTCYMCIHVLYFPAHKTP